MSLFRHSTKIVAPILAVFALLSASAVDLVGQASDDAGDAGVKKPLAQLSGPEERRLRAGLLSDGYTNIGEILEIRWDNKTVYRLRAYKDGDQFELSIEPSSGEILKTDLIPKTPRVWRERNHIEPR